MLTPRRPSQAELLEVFKAGELIYEAEKKNNMLPVTPIDSGIPKTTSGAKTTGTARRGRSLSTPGEELDGSDSE